MCGNVLRIVIFFSIFIVLCTAADKPRPIKGRSLVNPFAIIAITTALTIITKLFTVSVYSSDLLEHFINVTRLPRGIYIAVGVCITGTGVFCKKWVQIFSGIKYAQNLRIIKTYMVSYIERNNITTIIFVDNLLKDRLKLEKLASDLQIPWILAYHFCIETYRNYQGYKGEPPSAMAYIATLPPA